jgi:hypothetical protein
MRGFPANKLRVATFDGTDGRRMEVPQTLAGRSPRVPTSSAHRDSERVANHSVKISREIVHRYQNSGPSAGTIGSHMYKRTGAKNHNLVRLHGAAAPDRRGTGFTWQRNKDHPVRHADKRNARERFLAGQKAEEVQCDPCQPGPKLAMTRDDETAAALLRQGGCKVSRLREE